MQQALVLELYLSTWMELFLFLSIVYSAAKRGIMVKVLFFCLEVSVFELSSCYYVHFRTNTLDKGY